MNKQDLKLRARDLRSNMTPQERKIWNMIRSRQFYGYRFLRQFVIGSYIVDFLCREKNIVIEIDGGQHNEVDDIEYDSNRTDFLIRKGYKVIRFWNNEIDGNIQGVYECLKKEFGIKDNTHPNLPYKGKESGTHPNPHY